MLGIRSKVKYAFQYCITLGWLQQARSLTLALSDEALTLLLADLDAAKTALEAGLLELRAHGAVTQ